MRIGISSFWFNRGQAVVARQLRSALDSLGHETFVLARPTRGGNLRPSFIAHDDVWVQPGVTDASAYEIPGAELESWASANNLEVALFDQNYQFEEIERLRESGVRTIGRFVWEQFADEHVGRAKQAFDVVYSMTACEQERYREIGIESPRVRWGIHPELLVDERQQVEQPEDGVDAFTVDMRRQELPPPTDTVTFFFPGGFMSRRKPIEAALDAFRKARGDHLRLVVKTQVSRGAKPIVKAAKKDPRIELITDDLPAAEHLKLFASADVCLAPSRWEGLGLHLYEATALGLPIITNDNPPMNEVVRDGVNGILVAGVPSREHSGSGIPAFEPDVAELTAAIERLADPAVRTELAPGVARVRDELSWERTVGDLSALLESL